MRLYALLLLWLFSTLVLADTVNTDLLARALNGDKEARLTLARVFNDREHSLYYPEKSMDMYVKLARDGHQEAFRPLADAYSNPESVFYNPARAITYLKRLPDISPGRVLMTEALSYRLPLSRLSVEIEERGITSEDPYYPLLQAFQLFPFHSASSLQRKTLISVSKDALAEPYLPYIYPALVLPVAAQTHLFRVADAAMGGKPLPPMTWHEDTNSNRWYPITETQGVEWAKFVFEPDDWRGQRLAGIVISYPRQALSALHEYYSAMMLPYEDGWRLPGVFLRLNDSESSAYAEFIFTAVKPLLHPARLPEESEKRKAIPRMLFTSTIESK